VSLYFLTKFLWILCIFVKTFSYMPCTNGENYEGAGGYYLQTNPKVSLTVKIYPKKNQPKKKKFNKKKKIHKNSVLFSKKFQLISAHMGSSIFGNSDDNSKPNSIDIKSILSFRVWTCYNKWRHLFWQNLHDSSSSELQLL
jgi:hypothetical protein